DHALGDAEARELRVDVRTRPRNDVEPDLPSQADETRHVEPRIGLAEIEIPRAALVNPPGDVRVDEGESERLDGVERRAPGFGLETPIMRRAGEERHHLVPHADPRGNELDLFGALLRPGH